jgi:hypothetical protein
MFKQRFLSYEEYGNAVFSDLVLLDGTDSADEFTANNFASVYLENEGEGNFKIIPLTDRLQYAPLFGICPFDIDSDEFLDMVIVGNMYGFNPFWGRADAMNGAVLTGNGNGAFKFINYPSSGFIAGGDAKALVKMPITNDKVIFIVSQNQDSLECYSLNKPRRFLSIRGDEAWAEIELKNGMTRKEEFYYGSSYLSQSARVLYISEAMASVIIYNFRGEKRVISNLNSFE